MGKDIDILPETIQTVKYIITINSLQLILSPTRALKTS